MKYIIIIQNISDFTSSDEIMLKKIGYKLKFGVLSFNQCTACIFQGSFLRLHQIWFISNYPFSRRLRIPRVVASQRCVLVKQLYNVLPLTNSTLFCCSTWEIVSFYTKCIRVNDSKLKRFLRERLSKPPGDGPWI